MISRPIKYRAWTGNEMVAVQSLCFNDKGCIWYGRAPHMGWAFVWPEAEWTKDDPCPTDDLLKPVMQWTGKRDEKGVEIWESDIMSYQGENLVVTYDHFGFVLKRDKSVTYLDTLLQFQGGFGPNPVVIGNIHQNPELLTT